MKILFIFVDKMHSNPLQQLILEYKERLKHYCSLELITIIVPKNVRYKSIEEQKQTEENLILKRIKNSDFVILLDESGKEMSSLEFSKWLEKNSIFIRLVFVVGGPYGFSENMKKQFPQKLSLSKMTFSHEMVRLFLLEQVYRAFTILKGEKYHH